MTFINRCILCDKYYVDNKHIICVSGEYYCLLCIMNEPDVKYWVNYEDYEDYTDDDEYDEAISDEYSDYKVSRIICEIFSVLCRTNNIMLMKKMIDYGVNINKKLFSNQSFLYIACRYGTNDMIKSLIEKGADINHTINDYNESSDIYKLLIKLGAEK